MELAFWYGMPVGGLLLEFVGLRIADLDLKISADKLGKY